MYACMQVCVHLIVNGPNSTVQDFCLLCYRARVHHKYVTCVVMSLLASWLAGWLV